MKNLVKTIIVICSLIVSLNSNAQLKVNTDGTVKIGSQTPYPIGGKLQITGINQTLEARIFSESANVSRLWTANSVNALALGIDGNGYGHVWSNISSPTEIMAFNLYGSVSIGASAYTGSYYKFVVYGPAYSSSSWTASDSRLKENIKSIEGGALDKVKKLRGTTYNLKNSGSNEKYYGFIAQELREVIPEVVCESNDSLRSLAVNYEGIIPILAEAIKEQQKTIEELSIKIEELENVKTATDIKIQNNSGNKLYQNSPNPFNSETSIKYCISISANSAMINIYDMQGTQIKSIPVTKKGEDVVVIQGAELKTAMYLYSLIVDGIIIDTKTMVITE